MRAIFASGITGIIALCAPVAAGAATFGADLSRPADSTLDCTIAPSSTLYVVPSGADTCTWWTTGSEGGADTSEGHVVPYGGGTITAARVKVGPTTGPMQFVVMRSLRHPGSLDYPACCFPVGASAVFTPAANGITEVPMNVATRHDTDPASGINNYDHIAISVLEPGVPVPADFTGFSFDAPTGGAFYPHYEPGTERTTGLSGVVGYQTLINADIDQSSPGTGTPTGPTDVDPPGVDPLPPVALGGGVAPVRGSRAAVPVACRSAEECAGRIRLQRGAAVRVAASGLVRESRRAAGRTYGRSGFSIPAGEATQVRVKLNKAGRRLLERRKSAKVYANLTLDSGESFSDRVKLKRKR